MSNPVPNFSYHFVQSLSGNMEEEVQELRELVWQLRADNERLRRECAASPVGYSGAPSASLSPASHAPSAGTAAAVTERLVVIPMVMVRRV